MENIVGILDIIRDIYYVKIGMGAYAAMLNVQYDNNINININGNSNDYAVEMSVGQLLTTFMRSK